MSAELTVSSRRGVPKGDKRERTRSRLIEAACELIREEGYQQLTLAGVAERAGMTTGAIYGNFRNRTDLLAAVGRVRGAPIRPKTRPGMSFRELMRAMAEAVIEALPQRREAMVGTLGFHAETLQNDDLRRQSLAEIAELYRLSAAWLASMFPEAELPMPADALVRAIHALTDGLVLHRILTPELIGDDVIFAAFDALAGAARDTSSGPGRDASSGG
jgi:AcrR family transcriptional regulator